MLCAKRPIPQLQRKTLRLRKKPWWPPRNRHTITYTTYIHILTYACLYACMYVCMLCRRSRHSRKRWRPCTSSTSSFSSDYFKKRRYKRPFESAGYPALQTHGFPPSHYIHTFIYSYIHTYIHSFLCALKHTKVHTCINMLYIHKYIHTYIHTATHFAMWWWSWRPLWTSCPLPTISTRTTSASPGARPSLVRYVALRILTNSIIHTYIHLHPFLHVCIFTWIHIQRYSN